MSYHVQLTGNLQVLTSINRWTVGMQLSFGVAVYLTAGNVLTTALRLTPVDTGYLRKTRYLTKPTMSGPRFRFEIGFTAAYAVFVHEVWASHPVGEWKFLETAMDWHAPTFMSDVARLLDRASSNPRALSQFTSDHPDGPVHGPDPPRPRRKGRAARSWREKRAKAAIKNRARISAEVRASLAAQQRGALGPRPGTGG